MNIGSKSSVFTTHAVIRMHVQNRRSRTLHMQPNRRSSLIHEIPTNSTSQNHCDTNIYPFVEPKKSSCFPDAHGESSTTTITPCPSHRPSCPHSSSHLSSFRPAGEERERKVGLLLRSRSPRSPVGKYTHSHNNKVKESSPVTHAFIHIHASSQAAWDKQSANRPWHHRDDAKASGSNWDG